MPTQSVTPSCTGHLQDIADVLSKAKKVVVVTGAGISTNLGIPDFRSENGLYALIQAQYDAAAAEREKVEREELKRSSKSQSVKSRSPSPNKAGALESSIAASTRPFEPFTIKTRSTTVKEAQDARIFTRSQSDLTTTWSRRQTLDNPDTLLRRTSSSTPKTHTPILRRTSSSVPRTSEPTPNTTSTPKTSRQPSLKRSRSLETLSTKGNKAGASIPQRSSKRLKLLHKTLPTPSSSTNSSKDPSPAPDTSDSFTQTSIVTTTRAVLPKLKGKDLFDSMVWNDRLTTSIFLTFIAQLRKQIREEVVGTSNTHKLIKAIRDGGKLVRCYTQNIDGLESREGLGTNLESGTGRRSRFFSGVLARPRDEGGGAHHGGVEVVQLHGGLDALRCSLCGELSPWQRSPTPNHGREGSDDPERASIISSTNSTTNSSQSSTSSQNRTQTSVDDLGVGRDTDDDDDDQSDREEILRGGRAPGCQRCIRADEARQHRGRRSVAVGKLRPDVVLYGEEHPEATRIGELVTHDISLGPDIILIMGTSLRVHGLKVMVKEFARAAHAKGGKVVFVNNTKPPESTWGDILDYWVQMDCDRWVEDLKERRAELWLPQGVLVEPKNTEQRVGKPDSNTMPARKPLPGMPKSAPTTKTPTANSQPKPAAKRPQCQRDDEMNGAYWAYQIHLNLEIIGGRPRTYAPNCNPYRKWGNEKWRRDNGKQSSSTATSTSSTPLKSITTNVPRQAKADKEKASNEPGGGSSRAAGSQLQRELSASVVGPGSSRRSSLLLPTPPPSDETEEPDVTVATPARIKAASSIERILSSPVGKKNTKK